MQSASSAVVPCVQAHGVHVICTQYCGDSSCCVSVRCHGIVQLSSWAALLLGACFASGYMPLYVHPPRAALARAARKLGKRGGLEQQLVLLAGWPLAQLLSQSVCLLMCMCGVHGLYGNNIT